MVDWKTLLLIMEQIGACSAGKFSICQSFLLKDSYEKGSERVCVDEIGSRPRGILCVDKIRSRPRGIFCVDKIGSPEMLAFLRLFAHLLFQNQRMITSPIEK